MSKTLEEFIEKHVSEFSEGKGIAAYAIKQTAAEILRALEGARGVYLEPSKPTIDNPNGYIIGHWDGMTYIINFLKSYINGKEAEASE